MQGACERPKMGVFDCQSVHAVTEHVGMRMGVAGSSTLVQLGFDAVKANQELFQERGFKSVDINGRNRRGGGGDNFKLALFLWSVWHR